MNEDIVGPRGKRILYSWPIHGYIHKEDVKYFEMFKKNCSKKGVHMNYDGKKEDCGWSILLKRNNRIEDVLIPIAEASGIDVDVFIDEFVDRFLESIKLECKKNGVVKEIGRFRKDTIGRTVSKIVEVNQ